MQGVARFGQTIRRQTHLLFAGLDVLAAARAGQGSISHASLTPAPFARWLGSIGEAEDVANGLTIRGISSSPGGHTLIVYQSLGVDKVFALGRNEAGQLGIGYNSQESTRGLVESFGECESVLGAHTTLQSSFIHSLADGRGVLHAFGSAQRGQNGLGKRPDADQARLQGSPRPTKVNISGEDDVVQVATGYEHALVLASEPSYCTAPAHYFADYLLC